MGWAMAGAEGSSVLPTEAQEPPAVGSQQMLGGAAAPQAHPLYPILQSPEAAGVLEGRGQKAPGWSSASHPTL